AAVPAAPGIDVAPPGAAPCPGERPTEAVAPAGPPGTPDTAPPGAAAAKAGPCAAPVAAPDAPAAAAPPPVAALPLTAAAPTRAVECRVRTPLAASSSPAPSREPQAEAASADARSAIARGARLFIPIPLGGASPHPFAAFLPLS